MPPSDLISEMGAWSVPLNGAATALAACEMLLVVLPSAWTSRKTADPRNAAGHAVLVDQAGLPLVAPLAGFSVTAPGIVPMEACAAEAAYTPSSAPPAATVPASDHPIKRRFLLFSTVSPSLRGIELDLRSSCSKKTRNLGCSYDDSFKPSIIKVVFY